MKDFIEKTLNGLWASAGFDQVKGMDPATVSQLVQVLLVECKRHKIPDLKKQDLIKLGIEKEVAAGYFRGLNAALLNKWFYSYGISKQGQSVQAGDPQGFAERQEENKKKALARIAKLKEADPNWCIENEIKDYIKRIKVMMNRLKPKRQRFYPPENGTEDVEYTEALKK